MDNASYHSVLAEKYPTKSSRKSDMIDFPNRNIQNFKKEDALQQTRETLWLKIGTLLPNKEKQYAIDEILKKMILKFYVFHHVTANIMQLS